MNEFAALMNHMVCIPKSEKIKIPQIESILTLLEESLYAKIDHIDKKTGECFHFKTDDDVEAVFNLIESSCTRIKSLLKETAENPDRFLSLDELVGKDNYYYKEKK